MPPSLLIIFTIGGSEKPHSYSNSRASSLSVCQSVSLSHSPSIQASTIIIFVVIIIIRVFVVVCSVVIVGDVIVVALIVYCFLYSFLLPSSSWWSLIPLSFLFCHWTNALIAVLECHLTLAAYNIHSAFRKVATIFKKQQWK